MYDFHKITFACIHNMYEYYLLKLYALIFREKKKKSSHTRYSFNQKNKKLYDVIDNSHIFTYVWQHIIFN